MFEGVFALQQGLSSAVPVSLLVCLHSGADVDLQVHEEMGNSLHFSHGFVVLPASCSYWLTQPLVGHDAHDGAGIPVCAEEKSLCHSVT